MNSNPVNPVNPVIEIMETCRAMRYLSPDPLPDDVIDTILYAATRASSPGNSQAWDFVVVTDPAQRARLGEAMSELAAAARARPLPEDPTDARTSAGARVLLEAFGQAPAIVFVCVRNVYPPAAPKESHMWSAGFAASQNLIVAARSLGVGSVFTTLHERREPEIRAILGVPEDVRIATTIPLGWPARAFGPLTRRPMAEVVHRDRW